MKFIITGEKFMHTKSATRLSAAKTSAAKNRLRELSMLISIACTPGLLHAQEASAEAMTPATEEPEPETVIVTGTRASGLDEFSSSSPVQVLDSEEIQSAGRPDLMSALANVV